MAVSLVIPVLNEARRINEAIAGIRAIDGHVELIVVDGSPEGETVRAITDNGVIRLTSSRGRASQMNRGASQAKGEALLFLHADTDLPLQAFERIESILADDRFVGGAFDLEIGDKGAAFRMIGWLASLRSRLTRIPYGDQAIFLRRNYFNELGGFRDMPIMEDVDLMRRVRRAGGRICIVKDRVRTSSRRWRKEGILRCTLRNRTLMLLYLLGVAPEKLARRYTY